MCSWSSTFLRFATLLISASSLSRRRPPFGPSGWTTNPPISLPTFREPFLPRKKCRLSTTGGPGNPGSISGRLCPAPSRVFSGHRFSWLGPQFQPLEEGLAVAQSLCETRPVLRGEPHRPRRHRAVCLGPTGNRSL